ncbi:MAG: UDP-N-acetylmuramoyl-L-alanyl-D-glutamate--2,6-diaminopimelate ligase [Actinomycetaceae bacterium]|nr:UDP-N-acetylmuramoyl-L-alanyl-D-glutamate--2,6-diaminopimelate ligase [Actinomycetaceae bacterium]MDY6083101.1 UDP-N-acetylmuramoyl-L-alanyl-D-glutamate--2,6-diaminopimelate ligase [Actinomycetaceae bacterium]
MSNVVSDFVSALDKAGILFRIQNADHVDMAKSVSMVTYDSRTVVPGSIFIVKGAHFQPRFLHDAVSAGALACVIDQQMDSPQMSQAAGQVPMIFVTDIHRAIVLLGQLFYDHATDKLAAIGITGTKGKSTVTYMMRAIESAWLTALGKPGPAILSSIKNYAGDEEEESHLTTPEPLEIYQHFFQAQHHGIEHMVMEVSSQALKYGRVDGLTFDAVAFTNIGQDHISPSEHPDFEDYYTSKLSIFDHASRGVVNLDADLAQRTLAYARERLADVTTYGMLPEADMYCDPSSIRHEAGGYRFQVHTSAAIDASYSGEYFVDLAGAFNVSNALCAIALSAATHVPASYVRQGLARVHVPGRMEVFTSDDGKVVVIVDYAHNRLSFDAVMSGAQNEYPGYDLLAVFGSAGGKAYDRRKDLPEVASQYCSHVFITEEDDYNEPFESIAADLAAHMSVPYTIEYDRGECIRRAILDWPGKHVVLALAKGVETTRARGNEYVECPTDADYAQRYLAEYNNRA